MAYNIKEMVKNKTATFQYYRKGEFIYATECGFEFPVPLEDIGDATFHNEEKAIHLMRWINKHISVVENQ